MANPSAFVFPLDFDKKNCALVPIPVAMAGYVWGALEPLQNRERWQTEQDWQQGYAAIAEIGACMMAGCLDELIESSNRVYRLLDTVFNGAVYTFTGAGTPQDPYVFSPPLPVVPPRLPGQEPSVKFSLEKSLRLIDNLVNATTYDDAPDGRNVRQQLEDLILAVQEKGGLDAEMLAELVQIAASLV